MNLKQVLQHNYKIVKHIDHVGDAWEDFITIYTRPEKPTEHVNIWWIVTDYDKQNKKWRVRKEGESYTHTAGFFEIESLRDHWRRQLEWYYEFMEWLK